ncbi:MAG TPA: exosortase A [Croceibacterium sp.]|nr:exosortase A [Croceibacterium sp.]
MPLEAILPASAPASARLPAAWRLPLVQLSLAWIGLVALLWGEWRAMAHQWWDISTYNHILLIPPILAWLVKLRAAELARLVPQAWWPGLVLLAGGLIAWLVGSAAGINLVSQLGAMVVLQAAVVVLLGPRVAGALLFPLGYMAFMVPFGDELIPALQAITARLAVALTHASGVPAQIDGVFIDTPAGLFVVAEACSGVKFLIAMVALGALVAHTCFASARRRAAFMAAAVIVPVLANGVRAWGTIYIAQSQGIEFAAGFDHIVYGWIFFALVMTAVLGAAWRFFDRSPDDPPIDAAAIAASPRLARLARFGIGGWTATATILALAGAVAWLDPIARLP